MENINLIYYSPTGTTQKICREIGERIGWKLMMEYNMAEEKTKSKVVEIKNGLTIIGSPVYGGRLPLPIVDTLKQLRSDHLPVIIVVVYGNRDYDDALLELKAIVEAGGFKVIAGAAFIGEHSYSTNEKPIARNRPDYLDLEKCRGFGGMVLDKLNKCSEVYDLPELVIPGNFPYKERKQASTDIYPKTDTECCNLCGICADVCPVDAISIDQDVITDGNLCTACCACVKQCPEQARTLDDPAIEAIREKLFLHCSIRREPEYFV